MRHALVFNVISLVTFLLAVVFLAVDGLNFGVDFRGGTVIEVQVRPRRSTSTACAARSTSSISANIGAGFGRSDTALIRLPLKEGVVQRAAVRAR